MKKVFVLIAPLFIAIIVFVTVTYFLNKNSGKGALQVTSVPQSNVYLNGKLIGKTPLCIGTEGCKTQDMLSIGEYSIKLDPLEGDYTPYDAKISINKSTLTVVDRTFLIGASSSGSVITLTPISDKKDAQLLVISLPTYGNVFLDSNQVGITPLLLKNLTESDHDLHITKDGYSDKLIKIRTALGYKLTSLVFLGVNPNFASISGELQIKTQNTTEKATKSATASSPKIVILNTPTGFLRVREEGSISSLEIARVFPGEVYTFIDEKDGWFKIKTKNDKIGWVSAQYAKKE
ncbi:MAG: PEGA domain-containing protein [Patescibacteria group bacterium]